MCILWMGIVEEVVVVGKSYPNARDCEHGRQRGKCIDCDYIELEKENARLRKELQKMKRFGEVASRDAEWPRA